MTNKILVVSVIFAAILAGYVLLHDNKGNVSPTNQVLGKAAVSSDKQASAQAGKQQLQEQKQAQSENAQQRDNNQQTQNNEPMELKIETTTKGTENREVKTGDTVEVKYTGKLTDGSVFDATDKHGGAPFSFTVGQGSVIKGWDQGLIGMKVGEKRTLTIPSDLGYGPQGYPGVIPPNATLIFDIELVSIK